jgi:hypothetical protein
LAVWWKQLAPWQPKQLWIGHLLLHRVEALAAEQRPVPLDALSRFVLQALNGDSFQKIERLDQRLHLGSALLHQALRTLAVDKLVQPGSEGWSLTAEGRDAAARGTSARPVRARRPFYFVVSEESNRPQWLNLRDHPAVGSWRPAGDWYFDPRLLVECTHRPRDWKEAHGFPPETEVLTIPTDESSGTGTLPWQQVVLDVPKHLLALLVLAPVECGGERLLGFATEQNGWLLHAKEPAFTVDSDWQETFPELIRDPALDHWIEAWRSWCHPRSLPAGEVEACFLERRDSRLRVRAGRALLAGLRAGRSDVFRGEAWVVAGSGQFRSAAQLEMVEAS